MKRAYWTNQFEVHVVQQLKRGQANDLQVDVPMTTVTLFYCKMYTYIGYWPIVFVPRPYLHTEHEILAPTETIKSETLLSSVVFLKESNSWLSTTLLTHVDWDYDINKWDVTILPCSGPPAPQFKHKWVIAFHCILIKKRLCILFDFYLFPEFTINWQ